MMLLVIVVNLRFGSRTIAEKRLDFAHRHSSSWFTTTRWRRFGNFASEIFYTAGQVDVRQPLVVIGFWVFCCVYQVKVTLDTTLKSVILK